MLIEFISGCPDETHIHDGICDDSLNNMECVYDGGDCCFGVHLLCEDCMCNIPAKLSKTCFSLDPDMSVICLKS